MSLRFGRIESAVTNTGAPWQKGFELAELKRYAAIFKEAEKPYILGAFTATKETHVAEWLAGGMLWGAWDGEDLVAALAARWGGNKGALRDFTGRCVGIASAEDVLIKNWAVRDGRSAALWALVSAVMDSANDGALTKRRLWVWAWQERPEDRRVLSSLGLTYWATDVEASSELRGLWGSATRCLVEDDDWPTLRRLPVTFDVKPLLDELPPLQQFAQHYSGYNKRKSWSALSLRGYGPEGAQSAADFIIKPAEMSMKWKRENPEKLRWLLSDSPLRAQLPAVEPIVEALGEVHRLRLMQLAPNGGELTRHADITDPEAGTKDGQTMRLHIPLVTNERVQFEQWDLMGQRRRAHMRVGECWYLDTRKPHRAWNAGAAPRVHLVLDVVSSPAIRELLRAGEEAVPYIEAPQEEVLT